MVDTLPRERSLEQISDGELDLLIIGGGIVGAGIARDAALRGLRTGLVEQSDFASGTSSRSSRLLHGGLRYLAQGRIGLVREAGVEKNVVHRIAPHISDPLPFVFPTYQAKPWDQWPLWKLTLGVHVYDMLSGIRDYRRSHSLRPDDVLRMLPGIKTEKLTGGVWYYDGLTNDSRLVIDTLRSAAKAGAVVVNYCRLLNSAPGSGLWKSTVRDQETDETHTVVSRCIANATGPWAEQFEHSKVRLHLTKGVHLVVERDRLPVPNAVVMTEGSRVLFAIPWGERVILGTTDTDYEGRPEDVRADPEDAAYILGVVNESFPDAHISEQDVIASWAGVRPLIAGRGGGPSDISRSHEIRMAEPGWWDVAGGKLTTYRLMAEQTVDRIQAYLGMRPTACITAEEPLLTENETDGVSTIVPLDPSPELVRHFCSQEWAIHLDDVMVRRSGWAYYFTDRERIAGIAADWMASTLSWDEDRKDTEFAQTTAGFRGVSARVSE